MSLCLWGSAYWFIERGANGHDGASRNLVGRPDRVRVLPIRQNINGFVFDGPNGSEIPFLPSEVIWLRFPNPVDGIPGYLLWPAPEYQRITPAPP